MCKVSRNVYLKVTVSQDFQPLFLKKLYLGPLKQFWKRFSSLQRYSQNSQVRIVNKYVNARSR